MSYFFLAIGKTICSICWLILGAALQAAPSVQPPQTVSLLGNSRCGPLALSQLADAMKLSPNTIHSLLEAPAPARGYSVAETVTLAQTNAWRSGQSAARA